MRGVTGLVLAIEAAIESRSTLETMKVGTFISKKKYRSIMTKQKFYQ